MDPIPPEISQPRSFRSNPILNIFFAVCFLIIILYYVLSAPVYNQSIANRQGTMIHVAANESLGSIARDLEVQKIVRYAVVAKGFVVLFGAGRQIPRGDYLFNHGSPVWSVAWMLARGNHNVDPLRVTFKEGATNQEMANILASSLSVFRKDLFLSDPKSKQGYLFPDTYFFFPLTTSNEIVGELAANFKNRIASIDQDISQSDHSLDDIITMASIVEKEASGASDAPVIAGILWERIARGMPLQVDASKETYTAKGLPKEPISNPGLASIKAALHPLDSPYLYYLHEKNGTVHFAVTFAEHKANIARYLK